MSNSARRVNEGADGDTAHLDGLPDGCGCAEVWEHLSEARARAADD